MHQPRKPHLEAAICVLKFIKVAPSQGLFFPTNKTLKSYCDSDWTSCRTTRKSILGYCVFIVESLISWISKKQSNVRLHKQNIEPWQPFVWN